MQTNDRLFTDRPIHANLPDDDETGGALEALAHAALVFILLGALVLSGQRSGVSSPATPTPTSVGNVVAGADEPSPAPTVVRSL